MDWPRLLGRLTSGADLSRQESRQAMDEVMSGNATHAQIAGFAIALRMKGETIEEMTGLVEAVRAAAVPVKVAPTGLVDVVGTGGDRLGTFNISTAAALVAAGAGAKVAKHGNRSISSNCGSADVLEGLGMAIDLSPEQMVELLEQTGFAFFLAPLYHPAFRHAGPVRRELGIPTVFNFLGPLANPAGVLRQAIGVSDQRMGETMIGVLQSLGSEYSFVFCGEDGLDEITTTGPTDIHRLANGEVTHAQFTPEDFGVARASLADLKGGTIEENVAMVRSVLAGEEGPKADAVIVNASAALVAAGRAGGFVEGVEAARQSIHSGKAAALLEAVVKLSRQLKAAATD
jgi:anthranilate phosphoribosyltransferase